MATLPNDILMDDTGDVACVNGDFVIGDATLQHQDDLIREAKGGYMENPMVGVGIINYMNSPNLASAFREIRKQFSADGMVIKSLDQSENGIEINAEYK